MIAVRRFALLICVGLLWPALGQAQSAAHARHKPAPAVVAPPAPVAPAPPPVAEAPKPEAAANAAKQGSVTGLPLPRFAALRSDDVNLRVGPGTRYPIGWVYKRRDLPVEIEREFEVWRLVSDPDGTRGWVHQATLTGRRTFIVRDEARTMRKTASDTAPAVAVLKPGVVGRVLSCPAEAPWCEVQVGDYRGFLRRNGFWGTFPGEAVN
jgi:SH3-like domain-containing protein